MMLISIIAREARRKKSQYRALLKKANSKKMIAQLPELHEQVFEDIDCLECANCCKNYSPRFNRTDIKRISKYLNIKETELEQQYLRVDEDEDYVLKQSPCAFLQEDNTCIIYEVRPKDCSRYPYTDEDVLLKQQNLTIKNASVCPAVYKMLDFIQTAVDNS